MQMTSTVCPPGKSGLNCNSPLIAFNSSITNGSVPTYNTSLNSEVIYYIDFPVNSTSGVNISFGLISGSAQILFQKDRFPYITDLNAEGSEGTLFEGDVQSLPSTIFITNYDTLVGGRMYFTIVNTDGSTEVTFNVTSEATVEIQTTGTTGVKEI